ncbi:hypothetical protein Cs7R123_11160 [Catellatospora sp. TT07R-123]|uniref:hypothetical protein n=1 Tax=Catellatospora sp. TT07R-123 TaxID=2733863 RepID=UPI001B0BBA4A|nr:hypothetical protein [Catellatospora sp. TT07R-123]GHJ43774.1 hypothetical protein Cs7R123_11160 [Catellatospora sp. TT07R-123]
MARQRTDAPLTYSDLLVVEYEQLKEEQRARIASRDNLVYATLVAVGAVGAAALQSSPLMLLVLPPVCVILGWIHAGNDRKVWEIGRYIRQHLAPRLATGGMPAFAWETVHRADTGYRRRRRVQITVTLLTFCAPGLIAVGANVSAAIGSARLATLAATEVAGLLTLAWAIVANADRGTDAGTAPQDMP